MEKDKETPGGPSKNDEPRRRTENAAIYRNHGNGNPALAAVFGGLIYLIRASNFADFDTDFGLLWDILVECLVWSSAILILAWLNVGDLMKD